MLVAAINKDGQYFKSAYQGNIALTETFPAELNTENQHLWNKLFGQELALALESGELKLVPHPHYRFVGVDQGIAIYEDLNTGERFYKESLFEVPSVETETIDFQLVL